MSCHILHKWVESQYARISIGTRTYIYKDSKVFTICFLYSYHYVHQRISEDYLHRPLSTQWLGDMRPRYCTISFKMVPMMGFWAAAAESEHAPINDLGTSLANVYTISGRITADKRQMDYGVKYSLCICSEFYYLLSPWISESYYCLME